MPKFVAFGNFGNRVVCRVYKGDFGMSSVYICESCYDNGSFTIGSPFGMVEGIS